MTDLAKEFARTCASYLRDVHLVRLERAVDALPAKDLWWRPHDDVLSVGVILRHLEGNVRQWILSGLGDVEDRRERSREFEAPPGDEGAALLARLGETVRAAAAVIEGLDEQRLLREFAIQGTRTTALAAVLHVVEHFSWHVGQAVWIVKARAGTQHGLAFYDDAVLDEAHNG